MRPSSAAAAPARAEDEGIYQSLTALHAAAPGTGALRGLRRAEAGLAGRLMELPGAVLRSAMTVETALGPVSLVAARARTAARAGRCAPFRGSAV